MKLKTLINKLENERIMFVEEFGVEPTIFNADVDSWSNRLDMTITSKVTKDGCMRSTDEKKTKEIKVRF